MNCKKCESKMHKNGLKGDKQKWKCPKCNYQPTYPIGTIELDEQKSGVGGITEEQLRMKLDNRYILKKACEGLVRGTLYTNSEFVRNAGIKAGTGYREITEHPDFEKYRGKGDGVIYWGHPDAILKFKQEGILR